MTQPTESPKLCAPELIETALGFVHAARSALAGIELDLEAVSPCRHERDAATARAFALSREAARQLERARVQLGALHAVLVGRVPATEVFDEHLPRLAAERVYGQLEALDRSIEQVLTSGALVEVTSSSLELRFLLARLRDQVLGVALGELRALAPSLAARSDLLPLEAVRARLGLRLGELYADGTRLAEWLFALRDETLPPEPARAAVAAQQRNLIEEFIGRTLPVFLAELVRLSSIDEKHPLGVELSPEQAQWRFNPLHRPQVLGPAEPAPTEEHHEPGSPRHSPSTPL